jgi:hypothetical protein
LAAGQTVYSTTPENRCWVVRHDSHVRRHRLPI